MPLAPKLAATVLVTATVATLSVLSTPAYADSGDSGPEGGSSNVAKIIETAHSTVFACYYLETSNIPILDHGDVEVCVARPTP